MGILRGSPPFPVMYPTIGEAASKCAFSVADASDSAAAFEYVD
jgi:hypothetical protein